MTWVVPNDISQGLSPLWIHVVRNGCVAGAPEGSFPSTYRRDMTTHHVCRKCGQVKIIDDFPRHVGKKGGHDKRCIMCKRSAQNKINRRKALRARAAKRQEQHAEG